MLWQQDPATVQMVTCPQCHESSISIDENARALFKEIECPACGHRLRARWADPMRVIGVIAVLALAVLGFHFRSYLRSGTLTAFFICLPAVGLVLVAALRRLPLTRV
jgi:uncharacterized paraquat-inducible protein A